MICTGTTSERPCFERGDVCFHVGGSGCENATTDSDEAVPVLDLGGDGDGDGDDDDEPLSKQV